jgi:hypothetical protein
MGNSNSANKQNGGFKQNSLGEQDIRSIIENIVKNTAIQSRTNVEETIDMTHKYSDSTLDMSSAERYMRGGNDDLLQYNLPVQQRKRYLNVNTNMVNGAHVGGGCGCSGGQELYSETSSVMVDGSCGVPQRPRPTEPVLSATSSTMAGGNVYSATSSTVAKGAGCGITQPQPQLPQQNNYSETSSVVGSYNIDNNLLTGGSRNDRVTANQILSSTSSQDINLDMLGGAKKKMGAKLGRLDSEEKPKDSDDDDDDDDDDEDDDDDAEIKAKGGSSSMSESDAKNSTSDVLIDKKYLYSSSETFYGDDSSNARFKQFVNRQ